MAGPPHDEGLDVDTRSHLTSFGAGRRWSYSEHRGPRVSMTWPSCVRVARIRACIAGRLFYNFLRLARCVGRCPPPRGGPGGHCRTVALTRVALRVRSQRPRTMAGFKCPDTQLLTRVVSSVSSAGRSVAVSGRETTYPRFPGSSCALGLPMRADWKDRSIPHAERRDCLCVGEEVTAGA